MRHKIQLQRVKLEEPGDVLVVVVVEGLKFYTSVEEKCVIRRNGPGYFPPPPHTHPRPSSTLSFAAFYNAPF